MEKYKHKDLVKRLKQLKKLVKKSMIIKWEHWKERKSMKMNKFHFQVLASYEASDDEDK
jgi:hypothetical protein